ncbi:MAG: helix-turn-helix transcriptional regulator [Dermatophilaceae bacterium]
MSRTRAAESATARLSRLLTMVPWLLAHQGVAVDEAARQFGISREQLEADLALLFVCGTPGHLPDDLIEAEWEDGRVFIGNADAIARPLRLTVDEALTLMVGLRALAANPGITERDAVLGALAKLEQATGTIGQASSRVRVSLADTAAQQVLADARRAVQQHRRVRLEYHAPGRDEVSVRDVDPMRVVNLDSHWYLEGWCHRAQDARIFRLDRVARLDVLDADGTPPRHAQPRDLGAAVFVPSEHDVTVVLDVERDAAWFVDYYPHEAVVDMGEGRARVTLRVSDPTWVRRAAWRMGGSITVVSPAELAASVREGAQAAVQAYAGHDATSRG